MSRTLRLLALSMLMVLPAVATAIAQDSSYIKVPNEEPEMAAAKAKARATLGQFWEKLDKPGPDDSGFALKVAIPYGTNSTEHIWTKDVERRDGKIFAVINNVPRDAKTIRLGQRIEVADTQISDWLYMRSGKMVGNYTLRPLLKRMPPKDAERYRAMLADP
jgi:uncharacterized protein YegJ (DUF2314 family)